MAATDRCKVCKFFKDGDRTCHRNAPKADLHGGSGDDGGSTSLVYIKWPVVDNTDWCGEFIAGPYKGA